MNKFKKRLPYLIPILFLIGISSIVWYLFLYCEIITDNEKRITGIITILGLGFGVFQFWINELNIERRKMFDLRYETYKEIVSSIESLTEAINKQMVSNEKIDAHSLVSVILNQVNRIASIKNMNNQFLFPKITDSIESKRNSEILEKIMMRTDQFRKGIEKANDKEKDTMKDFIISTERMNWHNDIRKYLVDLHENKYEFYNRLRSYF